MSKRLIRLHVNGRDHDLAADDHALLVDVLTKYKGQNTVAQKATYIRAMVLLNSKQDFDGAVRFLEAEEAGGARIVLAAGACIPMQGYYQKAHWRCLPANGDWSDSPASPTRVLVAHTLAMYEPSTAVRNFLRDGCPAVRTFAGTLGDGDMPSGVE